MPTANVLRWRDGTGWLVLSGGELDGADESGDIEANALVHVQPGDPIAYIWAASDVESADKHLDSLEDLGAPTGYLVDILTEDDETIRQQLAVAGMILIADGPNVKALRSGLLGAALDGIAAAYDRGAVVLGIGQGAAIFGSFMTGQNGVAWIESAAVMPHYEESDRVADLRDILLKQPDAYGLGINSGSALALGPAGQIEAWGVGKVTVTLGRNLTAKQ